MKVELHGRCKRNGLAELIKFSKGVENITISESNDGELDVKEGVDKEYILEKDNLSNVIFEKFQLYFDGFTSELESAKRKSAPNKIKLEFEDSLSEEAIEDTIDSVNKIAFGNKAREIKRIES